MLVMYNRYHNYAVVQLRRNNENGRFSVAYKYAEAQLVAVANNAYQHLGRWVVIFTVTLANIRQRGRTIAKGQARKF